MSSSDLGNVRLGAESGREGGGRGRERRDYCPFGGEERERGAVCKTRGIRRAARLINRVLSSSNWQSSNNHLEAPPVNPELILGVTVRRHSYHSVRTQSSAQSLLSFLLVLRRKRVSHSSAASFSLFLFANAFVPTCLPIYLPPPFSLETEIFNSLPSFAFDLNFFNRSLKTGTTFRSRPSFRYPSCRRPLRSLSSPRDTLGKRGH